MKGLPLPVIVPLAAVLSIIVVAGGLGAIFTALNETALGEYGAIIIGIALVVGVPSIGAYLASRKTDQQDQS